MIQTTSKRFLLVDEDFVLFGGSQRTTANNLGRSIRTIVRRLSDRDRTHKGLPILERRQFAVVCDSNQTEAIDALRLSGDRSLKHVFSAKIGVFIPKCNIYTQSLELKGCRWGRKRLAAAVNKLSCVE